MDRRAAGALLALAACIASSVAAPTASNHTALDLYEGASDGCYYNFQHYGEGDRIMTNEPCLNCTCHNRMLMCYLRVCPFTKPIGQDCTVEKRADQCCPIVTCPDVPVDLLTSTSTSSPAEYGATGLGKLDKYGCSINGKYFPEGSKVPPTPNKPCEHCYCIRNMTTCVMQECTLHVDGCTPIYHKDVCCPIRYSCDHPEDEVPLLDDMSTTVRPTPGFLLTTTTLSPVTQMSQDCVHNDQIIADGASITTEKACEHCYCMKGDIVCVVQECGAPMENEGKNCTSLPPRKGQCCPDTYICEGDELNTDIPNDSTTESVSEKQTTLSPPRRSGVEGSGYRNEPSEAAYTETPSTESELEGSGEELEPTKPTEEHEALTSAKPLEGEEITTNLEDGNQYIPVTTKAPAYEEPETSTKETDKIYKDTTTQQDIGDMTSGMAINTNMPHEHVTLAVSSVPESYDKYTTESIESLNTVPDVLPEKEQSIIHEYKPIATDTLTLEESVPTVSQESENDNNKDATLNPILEFTSKPDTYTPGPEMDDTFDARTTDKAVFIPEQVTEKESSAPERDIGSTTPKELETITDTQNMKENEINKPEEHVLGTTNTPLGEIEKITTELNVAQNTVISAEEESQPPHIMTSEKTTESDFESTEKTQKENVLEPEEQVTTVASVLRDIESTAEPDKGLNTIPSKIDEQSYSQPALMEATISSIETKTTESTDIVDKTSDYDIQKSPIATETSTLPEIHVTKADRDTITTEPSFRKEDEANISTEKLKQEFGPTTIKTEFVDEGFIPTSTHEEKLSTGPDFLSTDEDITTLSPEYEKESEETVLHKQPTTESVLETSVNSVTLSEKDPETISQPEGTSLPSTEKSTDATALMPQGEIHEEPSRIPGEGDCLLNGVTYKNYSVVPSTNNCHTGCRCISSIVKCDPIICSPPPDYMSNCQSIYDTPDSCCPTYICDHPRETIPPQSDNQMSGTEPPIISPTIECRGDQCELSPPTKQPSELCTDGHCLSATSDKTSKDECGPAGCGDFVKEPIYSQPPNEHSGCIDGKCGSSKEDCADGKCQLTPTGGQQSVIKPCNGNDCKVEGEENFSTPLCENGHDCSKIEIPHTQTSTYNNCAGNDCDSNVILPPHKSQQEICKEKDGCKSEEITPVPSKCEGTDCVEQTDSSLEEDISKPSSESTSDISPLSEVTEKHIRVEEDNVSESTVSPVFEQTEKVLSEDKETITEEPNVVEKQDTKIHPYDVESDTNTPISNEQITTLKPHIAENTEENQAMETPESVNVDHSDASLLEKQATQLPDESGIEQTTKQSTVENEMTKTPEQTEEHTPNTDVFEAVTKHFEKSTVTEESVTKISDITKEYPDRSTLTPDVVKDYNDRTVVESTTKTLDITEEHTDESIFITNGTKTPGEVTKDTDVPHTFEEHETKRPDLAEKETEYKVTPIVRESTDTPDVTEKYSDNHTQMPEIVKEYIDEVTLAAESSTTIPDVMEKQTALPTSITEKDTKATDTVIEYTDIPSSLEDRNTETPNIAEKQHDDKISPSEDENTKTPKDTETPGFIKDHTDQTTTGEKVGTKAPDAVDESYVPVVITEDGTETPDYEVGHSDKPTLIEEEDKRVSDDIGKEPEDLLTSVEEVRTTTPQAEKDLTDKSTKVPDIIKEQTDETTNDPDIVKEQTSESTAAPESDTKMPNIKEEHTSIPVIIDEEETTKAPHYGEDDLYQTSSPEEHNIKIPSSHVDKTNLPDDEKEKPILVEEELPEKSTDMKETVEKKPEFVEGEGITESVFTEESSTESIESIEDTSKAPILIDNSAPNDIEETNTNQSKVTDSENKNKPLYSEKATEEPSVIREDQTAASLDTGHTDNPEILEVHTNAPDFKITESHESQFSDAEGSGTKAPEIYVTESEKETRLPESLMKEHTITTEGQFEKITQAPSYEYQTTENEGNQEPHSVTGDMSESEETSKSPDAVSPESPTTESQDSTTGLPKEVTMEAVTKQEHITKQPLREGEETTYHPSKQVTREMMMTTDSVEITTKNTEHEVINKQEEGSTSIPGQERETSITQSPVEKITKLHEEEQYESPDETQTRQAEEETTTKVFEEENIKPSATESHVADITPGYEDVSTVLETDKVTEAVNTETQTRVPESHVGDFESLSTKIPIAANKDTINVYQPDIYTPEKEEMITSTIDATVTNAPVKGFTDTKDTLSTDEEHTSMKYNEDTTTEQPTTKETDDRSEILISSSKTTTASGEYNTEIHTGYTETPISKETAPSKIYEIPTTTESSELLKVTSDSSKPVSGEPHRRTETGSISETVDVPASEENATNPPGIYPTAHADLSTVEPHTYNTNEPAPTKVTEYQEPASIVPEQIKTTESSYSESDKTDDQEIATKVKEKEQMDIENSTIIPELPVQSDLESPSPVSEPEMQKSSTAHPATFIEIHTDLPQTEISTEAPLSLVTEPVVGVSIEEHNDKETVSGPVSESEDKKQTTEKYDVVTSLSEVTTAKTVEVTKHAVETGQVEFSETTPYLIELEEHTHKIIEDISTVSSLTEKEPTYEEVTSTEFPSKAEHFDVQEGMTPSPSAEDHTFKTQEPLSSVSTSVEEYTQKVSGDTSNVTPLIGELTTETNLHGIEKVTVEIPGEVFETTTKQSEIPSIPSEETLTISEIANLPTTLSVPKETDAETKPVIEQATGAPAMGDDDEIPQKGITTSKIQDLEDTTPTIVRDTPQKLPSSESDVKVPIEEEPTQPHITIGDESIFSSTKATTLKQEELLTPSEEKYSTPEEKPTSQAVSSTSTAEVPKPPTEIEPTDEIPAPEDDGLSPSVSGYGEPDYPEEDQAFGPGTCRYGGKVYVSAQQIPRDDPCDFCFCFRSDIICLQQSCPPPIHGCHEEPIQGFCCPRYECPVSMGTTVNVTTTTTTTTTTLPPHFPTHGYKGAAQRRGCQIKGHTYKVGEVVRSSSGPCLHCTCGGDGQMKCDPKACTPEPMLRQMIAAAVSAKRRR